MPVGDWLAKKVVFIESQLNQKILNAENACENNLQKKESSKKAAILTSWLRILMLLPR